MVKLNVVHAHNKALVKKQFLTAVFVGATSGIGEYSARALASTHGTSGQGLRLYIVGRNAAKAKSIIADCQKLCPAGQFHFIQATDLALLKEVDRVCQELEKAEKANAEGSVAKIDLLVLSHASLYFDGRRETSEGLDEFMSWLYYSRVRFITQLLPLLLASPLPAHVISVYGPGRDQKIFEDDLSLRKPENYGFISLGSHAAYMTTFFFERLAADYPEKLSLTHYFPGLVWTPTFNSETVPRWFRIIFFLLLPILKRTIMVPTEESGARVIFHASPQFPARSADGEATDPGNGADIQVAKSSDGKPAGGAYRTSWNNEEVPLCKHYPRLRNEGLAAKVWDHTMKAFEDIAAGRKFTG